MKISLQWLAPLAVFFGVATAPAADYLGASAALAKAEAEAAAASKGRTEDAPVDSPRKIFTDFEVFKAAANLAPKDAATQWLALLNRTYSPKLRPGVPAPEEYRLDFRKFVSVLPPPPAWLALGEAMGAQETSDRASEGRKAALLWFAHRLQGNAAAMFEDYQTLATLNESVSPSYAPQGVNYLFQMQTILFQVSDDGSAVLRILNRNLERASHSSDSNVRNRPLQIPDLVSLIGRAKAAQFLKRAFAESPVPLEIRDSYETRKLAREVAAENISTLKVAPWNLAESMDAGALYAALATKFGGQGDQGDFRRARNLEPLRLLIAGKTVEAVALWKAIAASEPVAFPYGTLEKIGRGDGAIAVSEFFHDILIQRPELPYWGDYIKISVRAGQSAPMMTLLRATLDRQDLPKATRGKLDRHYADALLATGQVDEGVAELLKAAHLPNQPRQADEYPRLTPFGAAERAARIGLLYQRKEWIDQGVALARESLEGTHDQGEARENALALAKLLLDLDRGAEAEGVLIDTLAAALTRRENRSRYFDDRAADILCALVGVYSAADRSSDVLDLLQRATMWRAADLAQILARPCYIGQRRSSSLGACTARALLHTGQADRARPIVDTLIYDDAGSDRVYELLLELDKAGAIPILDKAYASDPFQERPLIWKAQLLFDAGKYEEAEKVARQAIKIDPSDGEEGPGDRMRVYAILADILEARGNATDAKIFRGVVQAIRLSEEADSYYAAGLVSQAVAMYQKSLGFFSDAYCIQSRLALRLLELGDWAGAEEHYRRAYELMPDSFGRVESHCFGCERAFAGEKQQTLAQRVFAKMAAERPTNPQIHYLLGYLYFEQNRYAEALSEFERAVKLDPDYLNAWKKIAAIGAQTHLPASLRNSCALNIIRLDPRGKHASLELGGVTDLAAIWEELERRAGDFPSSPGDLYPLKASAEALASMADDPAGASTYQSIMSSNRYAPSRTERAPAAIFSTQPFTQAAGNFIQSSDYFNK